MPSSEIDDIDSIEELKAQLKKQQGQIKAAHKVVGRLEDTVEELHDRVDELESDVTVTQASVPDQSRTKLENVLEVVQYAYDKKNGGRAGVKVKSGEITAVIDGGKQTGLRLLDEIAGKFDWADAEKPGGPKENYLKIRLDEPFEDRKERVAQGYTG